MTENVLLTKKHILVCLEDKLIDPEYRDEFNYVKTNFCGTVISDTETAINQEENNGVLIYLCGNIKLIYDHIKTAFNACVIKELSYDYDENQENMQLISLGHVPINVHNAGVYFRKLFEDDKKYFELINGEHEFQSLTESNKEGKALRTGLYLSRVAKTDDEIRFNLLRCSTNLSGPTENFGPTDNFVVDRVNDVSKHFFAKETKFNHVLAQIYENHLVVSNNKKAERKAVIKKHSDKTKDMPRQGLIAFTTFYKDYSNDNFSKVHKNINKAKNSFDYVYNDGYSVLTKLYFKLKDCVNDPSLVKEFTVVLYPNSVFIIPLSTNRLYTHEIKSSALPIDKIPVRAGYVIRCSKTEAVFKDNQMYIDNNGTLIKLDDMSNENLAELKALYYKENVTDEIIDYGNFYFSMNKGDYQEPKV